jgi:hypothetical protein
MLPILGERWGNEWIEYGQVASVHFLSFVAVLLYAPLSLQRKSSTYD